MYILVLCVRTLLITPLIGGIIINENKIDNKKQSRKLPNQYMIKGKIFKVTREFATSGRNMIDMLIDYYDTKTKKT